MRLFYFTDIHFMRLKLYQAPAVGYLTVRGIGRSVGDVEIERMHCCTELPHTDDSGHTFRG